jgi:hypothetical protein
MDAQVKEIDRLIQKQISFEEQIKQLEEKLKLAATVRPGGKIAGPGTGKWTEEDNFLLQKYRELEGTIKAIRDRVSELKDLRAFEAITSALAELSDSEDALQNLLNEGLVTPLEEAEERARMLEKALRSLVQTPVPSRPGGFEERIGELKEKLKEAKEDAEYLNREAKALLGDFVGGKQTAREFDAETAQLTDNLAGAIGEGIREGILAGASAMETLGNVARNLFDNFLSEAVKNFQTQFTKAFQELFGADSALAGALTAIAGIIGGIFARRKSESSQAYNPVQDMIESNQVVRGIIAGPASVSIASVGENLERAMVPVTARLESAISVLVRIERNTRGGSQAGGSGGFPAAGMVPTV